MLSFAVLIISATAFSQTAIGIRAGVNNSSIRGEAMESLHSAIGLTNGIIQTGNRTDFFGGMMVTAPLGNMFGIETGVYYSRKGYEMKGAFNFTENNLLGVAASAELQSGYIDIPLLLNVQLTEGFYLYGGPQISYLAENNLRVKAGALGVNVFKKDIDVTESFNRTDWSVTAGAGYKFQNNFVINAGYEHGLSRLDKNGYTESYNKNFKIGIGYIFGR